MTCLLHLIYPPVGSLIVPVCQVCVNDAAAHLCRHRPSLLTRRDDLFNTFNLSSSWYIDSTCVRCVLTRLQLTCVVTVLVYSHAMTTRLIHLIYPPVGSLIVPVCQVCVNEAAAHLCRHRPSLLTRRDDLFNLALRIVKETGFQSLRAGPTVSSVTSYR